MKKAVLLPLAVALVFPLLLTAKEQSPVLTNLFEALKEIETMPLEICRGALALNQKFYRATERLSEAERREYFEKFRLEVVNAGNPTPKPPPRPGSVIDLALLHRCGATAN